MLRALPVRRQAHDSASIHRIDREPAMIGDNAYGSDEKRFAREHQAEWQDREPPELEWDETEVSELVDQILCEHRADD